MMVNAPPWIVAVGASGMDGLRDIEALLSAFPTPLPAIVLVVLHRPWDKPSQLRAVLTARCPHPILIAAEGERLQVGNVYIGQPSQHLTLAAGSLGSIVDDPSQVYRNRTVDLLFASLARHGHGRIIGVVLSGALDDGSRGLAAIHEAGGLTMVLTPVSPPKRSMPGNAIAYDGPIDSIGTPDVIASAITNAIAAT